MTTTIARKKPLHCDCHGNVVVGYQLEDGRIFWYVDSHKKRHFKTLPGQYGIVNVPDGDGVGSGREDNTRLRLMDSHSQDDEPQAAY